MLALNVHRYVSFALFKLKFRYRIKLGGIIMIFVKTDTNYKVIFVHYDPMNEEWGLNKTTEQLISEGMLVNKIPEPKETQGKVGVLFVNPNTKELYYKYENVPLTEESISFKLEALEIAQATTDSTLLELMESILI